MVRKRGGMKMYVIKYDRDIYAGTYNDMDGTYLYPSSYFNMQNKKEVYFI